MKQFFLILIFVLINQIASAQQIGVEDIDESKVAKWVPKFNYNLEGVYHFGESEAESTLIIIFTPEEVVAQISSGDWDGENGFVPYYRNLTNVRIENSLFKSDQYSGEFVLYEEGNNPLKGLKINNPWSESATSGKYEIGIRTTASIKSQFSGTYAEASYILLEEEDVMTMHPDELKIMRNEIFARYGYIFIKGGAMEKHFSSQKWYRKLNKNVDSFLTDIEKKNIQTILKAEKSQNRK